MKISTMLWLFTFGTVAAIIFLELDVNRAKDDAATARTELVKYKHAEHRHRIDTAQYTQEIEALSARERKLGQTVEALQQQTKTQAAMLAEKDAALSSKEDLIYFLDLRIDSLQELQRRPIQK